jgi:hypothetical protein
MGDDRRRRRDPRRAAGQGAAADAARRDQQDRTVRPLGFPKDVAKRVLQVWPATQDRLVSLEPQTPHMFATGSDHYVQLRDPDLTTSVIQLIFDRVRRLGCSHAAR